MSLKFTGEFCVLIMKNDAKFEEELICQFKIDTRNLTNLRRLYDVSSKSQIKHPKTLVGLYYTFKLLCRNLHLVGF